MPVKKGKGCVADVMKEWKAGTLHSGKDGAVVKDQDQAVAIALSMCGKSKGSAKGKNYVEQAGELLNEVKKMPQKSPNEFDLAEKKCGCKHKKGTAEYADCDCGCPECKKRKGAESFSEEEGKMTLAQLRKLRTTASQLIAMLEAEMVQGNEPEFEPWMDAKITLASDYVSAVHDYAVFGPGLEVEAPEEENGDYEDANARMTKLKMFGFKEGKH